MITKKFTFQKTKNDEFIESSICNPKSNERGERNATTRGVLTDNYTRSSKPRGSVQGPSYSWLLLNHQLQYTGRRAREMFNPDSININRPRLLKFTKKFSVSSIFWDRRSTIYWQYRGQKFRQSSSLDDWRIDKRCFLLMKNKMNSSIRAMNENGDREY